jgi:hypothetical protein
MLKIVYACATCNCRGGESSDHAIFLHHSNRYRAVFIFICLNCKDFTWVPTSFDKIQDYARGVLLHPKNEVYLQ